MCCACRESCETQRNPKCDGAGMTTLLAADIGGTKCELAVYSMAKRDFMPLACSRYPSRDYGGIEEIIARFLRETGLKPDFACLDVAGVTEREVATVTNLPWRIDARSLSRLFGFQETVLLNDMTAVCSSIALLGREDLHELQSGEEHSGQMIAVIAPGTGLGQGFLLQSETIFLPQGSEGGHADFAPVDDLQAELLSWMRHNRPGPVSYEDLIAGPGIPSLYDFLWQTGRVPQSETIRTSLTSATDRTPVIVNGGLGASPCPLCRRTIELFLAILGSEAGNLALKLYAKGGLYIGGGIMPRLVGQVSFSGFIENFLNKGKMEKLMSTIPIRLIIKKNAALLGAARYGMATFTR